MKNIPFVFFGTPKLATLVLEELKKEGHLPSLVVTAPDKPVGRGLKLTPSPVKVWTQENAIPTLEPEVFDEHTAQVLKEQGSVVFIVVAYGKILPQSVIDIPQKGILNVHPSLLPKFRGPSPVRSAILQDEKNTGVTVMKIDEKMDHGPILVQEKYTPPTWPPNAKELDEYLFVRGGALLADVLPKYVSGEISPYEQDHEQATYCRLFTKEDGLINLVEDPYTNLLKIHAYRGWPNAYFFTERDGKDVRINIASAHIENDELIIDEVIPEGKNKMSYDSFMQN
ncbi:methionyl-tRNA formyltransferase [Candidatus Kaiserbacteria bacterium]|nr:MAG: methionyl-tRNA formyltransferase [Candidatus Kaiserbacteria bacterium]